MDVGTFDRDIGKISEEACDAAREHALIESAAIGANVIEVVSIEWSGTDVVFVGRLPGSAVTHSGGKSTGRIAGRVHEVNAFHGSQGSGDPVGFLVVEPPITLTSGALPDDDIVHIALRIPALEASRWDIAVNEQGPVCCRLCNQIIPTQRLRAVKNARFCVKCQQVEENSLR